MRQLTPRMQLAAFLVLVCVTPTVYSKSLLPLTENAKPVFVNNGSNAVQGGDLPFLDKIVGGEAAKHGEIPWQASLRYQGKHHCGAAILNEFWLLTAAHCYKYGFFPGATVTVGDLYLSRQDQGQQDFAVERVRLHEQYDIVDPGNYDFALIKIKPASNGRGIQFNKIVQPISLPAPLTSLKDGTPLTISGWGYTEHGGGVLSDVLKKATVPYVNQETCKNLLGRSTITDAMFCAGYIEGGTDTCKFDSGGPVTYKRKNKILLVGIVSWGYECARPNSPGVYARVTTALPWIKRNMV